YNILTIFLALLDFKSLNTNFSIFYRDNIIIIIYINNLLITGASKPDINRIKATLNKRVKILDLEVYYFYLRIEVIRNRL
ncbi:uncharacterized protein K444DRAFT_536701, partial [Hyaloscypha bicolor E]